MKDVTSQMLAKAHELIEVCEVLYERSFFESVANRAYYANFTALNALFFQTDLNAKSHKGAHIQFNLHFISNGKLPGELNEILVASFEKRQDSDYDFGVAISGEEASKLIEDSRHFVDSIQKFIKVEK
ncbi:MAG TPA: HEPN domain-containing protein [Catalimonadaceae bacterium]|nr:HEPN domain-containing protein [Catalimonadaceae bacterium]HPI12541.1 HEPN domain-containing protein [Catalimonadaceae bacterium]